MVGWLSKTQGPENKNKGRVNAYYLATIKMVGLMGSWGWYKKDRKVVCINIGLFVFVVQTQIFFDQNKIKKMGLSVFESRQMVEG